VLQQLFYSFIVVEKNYMLMASLKLFKSEKIRRLLLLLLLLLLKRSARCTAAGARRRCPIALPDGRLP